MATTPCYDTWQEIRTRRGGRSQENSSPRLRRKLATLAGKPDLFAIRNGDALIIDAKTGRSSPHHTVQVMIYQYAVSWALEEYRGTEFRGHVIHPDANVQVPASGVDRKFVDRLANLIRRPAAQQPARKIPSAGECRWCDITSEDCPERVEWEPQGREGTTDDF